ncbi:hypothetical protein CPB84DRAFT_1537360 [Gymnopilus junonius]|uniref:Uncharacterized protein n=1 Tax=Gymnopilus junonius TaxID=109634 RepID=A0A9P5NGE8_GYMJU|nr:hypothetical protein CPB84DRAFT_1537360 [Gymnopilus junonius]
MPMSCKRQIPPVQYRGFEDDVTLWDCNIWMVFSKKSPLFGKVLEVHNGHFPTTDERFAQHKVKTADDCFDWIEYLELRWDGTPPCGGNSRGTVIPSFTLDVPVVRVDHREDDGKIMRNARYGWLFDVFSSDSIPQKAKVHWNCSVTTAY